jgi:hypothetical protein
MNQAERKLPNVLNPEAARAVSYLIRIMLA